MPTIYQAMRDSGKAEDFAAWMKKVDAAIERKVGFGMTSSDLPDVCYDDMFEDGYTPAAAARKAISYANGAES